MICRNGLPRRTRNLRRFKQTNRGFDLMLADASESGSRCCGHIILACQYSAIHSVCSTEYILTAARKERLGVACLASTRDLRDTRVCAAVQSRAERASAVFLQLSLDSSLNGKRSDGRQIRYGAATAELDSPAARASHRKVVFAPHLGLVLSSSALSTRRSTGSRLGWNTS